MIARPVPKRINGMRLPIFVCVLSEIAPNSGSRNSASTLSAAIIAPEYVSLRWNVLVSISGTMLLVHLPERADGQERKARQYGAFVVKLHFLRSPSGLVLPRLYHTPPYFAPVFSVANWGSHGYVYLWYPGVEGACKTVTFRVT